jgi:hypothetical protein
MGSARLLFCALCASIASAAYAGQAPAPADGWVVLPVDDYRALRAKAFPADPAPPPPPVDATVTRISYDLTVRDASVSGAATLTVDVFKEGWVRIGIPDGLLVGDARVDGRPLAILEQPSRHILLSRRGRASVTLQVVLPLTAAGNAEAVVVPSAGSATMQMSVTMPRTGVDLSLENAWLASANESAGATEWVAHARGDEPVTFTWRRRVEDRRASQPLKTRGSVTSLVGLGEDLTQISANVRVDVLSGLLHDVVLTMPATMQVARVTGDLVADWEVPAPGELRVRLLDPVAGSTAFVVVGEVRGGAAGTVEVPLVRLRDVDRETGGVAVEVLGDGEITGRRAHGLEPGDPLDLGGVVAGRESPSLTAYRFASAPGRAQRSLAVDVARYESQAVAVANIDEARYDALSTEDGKTLVRARYAVRNNRRSLMSVALPAGATLWSTSVGGRVVRPGKSPEGLTLVPLERGAARTDLPPFVVEVAYMVRGAALAERGVLSLPLPTLDLPISRTGVVLRHSPQYRVLAATGSFRVEPFAEPASPVLRDDPGPAPPMPPAPPSAQEPGVLLRSDLKSAAKPATLAGILPIDIAFPEYGVLVYLVAELTPETQSAALGLQYERERGN